jgi:glycerol uptake facilitator-like aquaporin
MITRKRIAMIMAEFLGTALLVMAVLAISRTSIGFPYFVGIGAGLVVAMATLVFGAVSGAHLNPIVTIGLWSLRKVKALPAVVYIASQILGGIAAYYLFTYFIDQTWPNTSDSFEGRVLVAEAAGAFVFSLGWAAAMYQRMSAGRAAATVGLSLALGVMVAAAGGGGTINPAVALGMHNWIWSTTVLGPVLGAIIGFNLYGLLFAPASELIEKSAEKTVAKSKKTQ